MKNNFLGDYNNRHNPDIAVGFSIHKFYLQEILGRGAVWGQSDVRDSIKSQK